MLKINTIHYLISGELHDILHDLDAVRRVGPTMNGELHDILHDLAGPTIELLLNQNKFKIITNDNNVVSIIQVIMPNVIHIPCNDAVLPGAPIGDETAVDTVLHCKLSIFQRLASSLKIHITRDALLLLKNCFFSIILLYYYYYYYCYA